VSGFPILLVGEEVEALIVGAGSVAARKAAALLESGASVRVVAPEVGDEMRALGLSPDNIACRGYREGDIRDALLVVAATDSSEVNARVAHDARRMRRLILMANAADGGNCTMAATHRAGELVIAVSAGGVPGAAVRIRDALAERFDGRYADAIAALRAMRRQALADSGAESWRRSAAVLVNEDFCDAVESGAFAAAVRQWV
jgi:siroheme synthase-like protein